MKVHNLAVKSTSFILTIIFCILLYINLSKYFASQISTTFKVEPDLNFPDFTICPFYYKQNTVDLVTLDTGHNVSEAEKLIPSMKTALVQLRFGKMGFFGNMEK